MNVCFFLGGLNGNGGIGRVVSVVANELSKYSDYNVFLLAYGDNGSGHVYEINDRIEYNFLYSEAINLQKAIFKGIIAQVRNYIKDKRIDVIIACGTNLYLPAVIAVKKTGAKALCWEHTGPHVTTDHSLQMICRKIGARLSYINVLLTKKTKEVYDKEFCTPSKNVVIANPIDDKVAQQYKDYQTESQKIIAVGRLTYQKNFPLMIKLFSTILKANPGWTVDIYGDGEEKEELRNLIENLDLSGQIILKGRKENIYELYNDYSFIVSTSRYEGFPMTLLEASANGLPMVSFDVETGPSEIIVDRFNGFLIPVNDIEMWKHSVEELIDNPNLRYEMSKRSKEKSKEYELHQVINEWIKVLQLCK